MTRCNGDPFVGPSGFGSKYYNTSRLQADADTWKFGEAGSPTENSLFVTGFKLDEINEAGPASQFGNIPIQWMKLAKWAAKEQPRDDFWRTLVADRGPDSQNCPEYYPSACEHAKKRSSKTGINTE